MLKKIGKMSQKLCPREIKKNGIALDRGEILVVKNACTLLDLFIRVYYCRKNTFYLDGRPARDANTTFS